MEPQLLCVRTAVLTFGKEKKYRTVANKASLCWQLIDNHTQVANDTTQDGTHIALKPVNCSLNRSEHLAQKRYVMVT